MRRRYCHRRFPVVGAMESTFFGQMKLQAKYLPATLRKSGIGHNTEEGGTRPSKEGLPPEMGEVVTESKNSFRGNGQDARGADVSEI